MTVLAAVILLAATRSPATIFDGRAVRPEALLAGIPDAKPLGRTRRYRVNSVPLTASTYRTRATAEAVLRGVESRAAREGWSRAGSAGVASALARLAGLPAEALRESLDARAYRMRGRTVLVAAGPEPGERGATLVLVGRIATEFPARLGTPGPERVSPVEPPGTRRIWTLVGEDGGGLDVYDTEAAPAEALDTIRRALAPLGFRPAREGGTNLLAAGGEGHGELVEDARGARLLLRAEPSGEGARLTVIRLSTERARR